MKIKNLQANTTTGDIVNEQTRSIVQLNTEMGWKTRQCKAVGWEQEIQWGEHSPRAGNRRVGIVGVGEDAGKQKACDSPKLDAQFWRRPKHASELQGVSYVLEKEHPAARIQCSRRDRGGPAASPGEAGKGQNTVSICSISTDRWGMDRSGMGCQGPEHPSLSLPRTEAARAFSTLWEPLWALPDLECLSMLWTGHRLHSVSRAKLHNQASGSICRGFEV